MNYNKITKMANSCSIVVSCRFVIHYTFCSTILRNYEPAYNFQETLGPHSSLTTDLYVLDVHHHHDQRISVAS